MRSVVLSSLLVIGLAGCNEIASPDTPHPPPQQVALPGPKDAPPLPAKPPSPKPLRGFETLDLDAREQRVLWATLTQLYAPCASEAVSIQQCIEESRACNACMPAARLIAAKIKEGATPDQVRELYGVRFGPNLKEVDAADSPARGRADAPVTITVWSDFECPHCKYAMPILERIVEKNAAQVRLVHKFYPLRQHSHAEAAARAAIAALNQGHYWEMERTLFEHQSDQTDSDLLKYAQDLRLDMNRFQADLNADRTSKMLERDHADAERCGLSGTPFILINGREFDTQYFHIEPDLESWVKLEIEMAAGKR